MNTIVIIILCILLIFHIINFIHTRGVHLEYQSNGVYIMWYSWVHNAYGEYYKLTQRICIWKIQPKQ